MNDFTQPVISFEKVLFDPKNAEHRRAYVLLKFKGKQHPYLRFKLIPPYSSLVSMMEAELAREMCNDFLDE